MSYFSCFLRWYFEKRLLLKELCLHVAEWVRDGVTICECLFLRNHFKKTLHFPKTAIIEHWKGFQVHPSSHPLSRWYFCYYDHNEENPKRDKKTWQVVRNPSENMKLSLFVNSGFDVEHPFSPREIMRRHPRLWRFESFWMTSVTPYSSDCVFKQKISFNYDCRTENHRILNSTMKTPGDSKNCQWWIHVAIAHSISVGATFCLLVIVLVGLTGEVS